jgi:hypothetical protein
MPSFAKLACRNIGIIRPVTSDHDTDTNSISAYDFKRFHDDDASNRRSMRRNSARRSFTFLVRIAALLLALGLNPTVVPAHELDNEGGHVLPPGAHPDGFSLEDMARLMGQFTTSGNNLMYYPKTPFQILYTTATSGPPPMSIPCPNGGTGFLDSGSNTFIVHVGTQFFLPLFGVDDSPPVLGTFPASEDAAAAYFFGPQQYGGRDFIIIVDGQVTSVGAKFLAGPVTTPPLLDGGGTHFIQLGVFLTPLSLGLHTITIQGEIAGSGVLPTYGFGCLEEGFSYFVEVIP